MSELDREERFKLLAGRDFAGFNLVYQTIEASHFDCPWLVTILNAVAQVLEDEHRYLIFLRSQCRQDGDTLVHVLLEEVACGLSYGENRRDYQISLLKEQLKIDDNPRTGVKLLST